MREAAIVIAGLVGLILVGFIVLHLWVYSALYIDGHRLRRAFSKNGRVISLAQAKENFKKKCGMIVVDAPTIGWNVYRVWWSPSSNIISRPDSWSKSRLCPDEDVVNYKNQIEPTSGVALLVDAFVFAQRLERYLKMNFGSVDCGFVPTGCVLTQLDMDSKRTKV